MQIEHFILDYLAFHSKCCCFLCVFFLYSEISGNDVIVLAVVYMQF